MSDRSNKGEPRSDVEEHATEGTRGVSAPRRVREVREEREAGRRVVDVRLPKPSRLGREGGAS